MIFSESEVLSASFLHSFLQVFLNFKSVDSVGLKMNNNFLSCWFDADTFVPTTVILHTSVCVGDPGIFTAQPVLSQEGASTHVLAASIPASAFISTCVSCSRILLYAFSHPSSSRKKKKVWHLEEIGGKSNLRSLGPSRSHAAYRGERDSGIIWTANFFTAKMAQPWIFLSSCPLLRFNGWVESSRTACSWHSPFAETSPCDGPQLRALEVPHHMFPPRITSSCRITGTRA